MSEKRGLDDVKLQHGRSAEYERVLQEQRERVNAKLAATRRTRLHYFGLAGGRR